MEATTDLLASPSPFEGPEKLLEIWFAPSPADVPRASSATDGRYGLRAVRRSVWEDMLETVRCKVLSVVEGTETDAYLLSESSLFVSPHRIILKTCGTTLNLLGLPRILEIAREHASLPNVFRCFYSRKSFFFPERQEGLHREWKNEVEYLDKRFHNGGAYSIGKMNGDYWLLYIIRPQTCAPNTPVLRSLPGWDQIDGAGTSDKRTVTPKPLEIDTTIEILMTHLPREVRRSFHFPEEPGLSNAPSDRAREISSDLGIVDLFPQHLTALDSYAFSPCGYSANALIKWGEEASSSLGEDHDPGSVSEGYYTIHVTPEDGWSYASFECNVPLSPVPAPHSRHMPDLGTLLRRVVDIFRPARLTLTLFISSDRDDDAEEEAGESAIEAAQRAFKMALTNHPTSDGNADDRHHGVYIRTDKINYDFGDYDLAFASFELAAP